MPGGDAGASSAEAAVPRALALSVAGAASSSADGRLSFREDCDVDEVPLVGDDDRKRRLLPVEAKKERLVSAPVEDVIDLMSYSHDEASGAGHVLPKDAALRHDFSSAPHLLPGNDDAAPGGCEGLAGGRRGG